MSMTQSKILLVDDDKVSLRILENILKSNGYSVEAFQKVENAMEYLNNKNGHPDLIISDYFMPGISGLEFLNEVKSGRDFTSIPFLFISANKNEEIETDALQYGAIDFLKKPINQKLLLNKISALLQSFGSFSLNANRIFEADSSTMNIHDIISYCEEEKLDGFTLISTHDGQYGVLNFANGILDKIQYNDLYDSEAFELLEQLQEYEIIIFRGKFNQNIIHGFFKNKNNLVKTGKKNISLNKLKGKLPTDKLNDLTLLFNELSDIFQKLEKPLNDKWISSTFTLNEDKYIKIQITDADTIDAFFFSSKDDLLKHGKQ